MPLKIHLNMDWDNARDFADYFQRILRALSLEHLLMGGSFLDIGCGDGKLIHEIAKLYPTTKYFGVDHDSNQVERAKRNNPDADIRQGYFHNLPFEDAIFTVASSDNIFSYARKGDRILSGEIPTTFRVEDLSREVYRVLKKGGVYCAGETFYETIVDKVSSSGLVPVMDDPLVGFRVFQKQ